MTAMVHELGISVVAEAIETSEQLDELTNLKCDVGQGYLFARPLTPTAVAEFRHGIPQLALPNAVSDGEGVQHDN
jgi:EAL domain-containing protein (putative c-di-GMP-specific phosphodiesterase class I)